MATVLDFSAGVPSPASVRAAGHIGAVRYVAPGRAAWMAGKPVTRQQADDYRSNGLAVVSNFEWDKGDARRGFAGGVADAMQANEIHANAGGPSSAPIFFSVDWDINLAEWNSFGVDYFRGVHSVIGKQRTGIYGHSRVCAWAIEDDVIGHSSSPGKRWAWQTRAWSHGATEPAAVLFQRVIDTASEPGPKVGGVTCDVNDVLADDFGQWDKHSDGGVAVAKPEYIEIDRMGNSRSNRWGARITNFLLHTEEGNGSAEGLAAYLNNSNNSVSYHYTIRDGIVVDVVDTDYASWSVLDANPYTINLCFAGSRASWSRDQWLAREHDISIAAWLAVQDCKKYGIPFDVIAPPYRRMSGISDHRYVTDCLGIGNHTDVGPNFPWDVFSRYVNEYAHGGTVEVINMINQEAARASGWIGERKTEGEIACPDGVGRFAEFDNAWIYWTPDAGAHAVPRNIFEAWAGYGWEAGPLGYPVADHTVLPVDGAPVGDVQAFQNGVLYRRYGQDGFYVTGVIGARWARSGYENGPMGWPTSNEEPFDGEGRIQHFDNGSIAWHPSGAVMIPKES